MKNKKNGMVFVEILLALIICGIIFVVSTIAIKQNDVTVSPYITYMMEVLPEANESVMEDCYNDSSCLLKDTLPQNLSQYCSSLADYFNTTGNINCAEITKDKLTTVEETEKTRGNSLYNFRLPNGITLYGLLNQLENGCGTQAAWCERDKSKFITVWADINSARGNNRLGEDIFPIRIMENGGVVPGSIALAQNSEIFGYRVYANRVNNNSTTTQMADVRSRDDNNVAQGSYITDIISFHEAICRAYGSNVTEGSDEKGMAIELFKKYYGSDNGLSCKRFAQAEECKDPTKSEDIRDNRTYCTVKPTRKGATGIAGLLGL